ncbi:MAG: hypothetical protein H7274_10090 [Rhodoferax sp.]|nr:hypothetical protein [Rhodoferax sp.]
MNKSNKETGTAKKRLATVADASLNDRSITNNQPGTSMQTNVPLPKAFAVLAHAYFRVFT